ncbi:MAG: CinA family protein [Clostridia bacterium]|nr:CinA family protein [Clostridia bacterium]
MKLTKIDALTLDNLFITENNDAFVSAVKALSDSGLTVSTAESCTGGLIGKMFTDVSGASAVFVGGMITYTNRVKMHGLGVSAETIAEHTEVSAECACEMAERARVLFESSIGISATGFAGPTGGNEKDGVGTVYLGISIAKETVVYRLSFGQLSRDEIRTRTALFAARALRDMLKKG